MKGSIQTTLRILGVFIVSICLGWILFAITVHEDVEDALGVINISPVIRKTRNTLPWMKSPAPAVKPAGSKYPHTTHNS
jgi:hypothetical protein